MKKKKNELKNCTSSLRLEDHVYFFFCHKKFIHSFELSLCSLRKVKKVLRNLFRILIFLNLQFLSEKIFLKSDECLGDLVTLLRSQAKFNKFLSKFSKDLKLIIVS